MWIVTEESLPDIARPRRRLPAQDPGQHPLHRAILLRDGRFQSARILNAGQRRTEPGLSIKRNKLPKLSAREVRELGSFLGQSDRPEGTLSFHELQGFLFAIACAPELIRPSEWLPLISNDEDMRYADLREAQHILGLIMVLYNQINASVIERSDAMPSGCAFLEDTAANLEEHAPVSQWSRGFVEGHNWLQDLWTEYVPDDSTELSKEFAACMMTLSFFSSRQIAEALYREGSGRAKPIQPEGFARLAATMRKLFPSALASYADIGRSIAEASHSDG